MKSRTTKQKKILEDALNQIDFFFTAEDLHEVVKKKSSDLGIATIYRFLKQLKEEKKLFSYVCDRKTVYSKQEKSHCHFICEKTGNIIHFEIDNIDFLKNKIPGTITSFQLEVKGICSSCEVQQKKK